jgi:hypothetical protein
MDKLNFTIKSRRRKLRPSSDRAARPHRVLVCLDPIRPLIVKLSLARFLPGLLVDRRELPDNRVPIGDPEQADGVAG